MRRVLPLVLLAVACHRGAKDPNACEEVGKHFVDLAHADVAKASADDATKRAVDAHVPAMRDAMVRACHDNNWPEDTRRCFVQAADDAAMSSCYDGMPADQRALLEQASAPPKE